jgi:hypothetical protein
LHQYRPTKFKVSVPYFDTREAGNYRLKRNELSSERSITMTTSNPKIPEPAETSGETQQDETSLESKQHEAEREKAEHRGPYGSPDEGEKATG